MSFWDWHSRELAVFVIWGPLRLINRTYFETPRSRVLNGCWVPTARCHRALI